MTEDGQTIDGAGAQSPKPQKRSWRWLSRTVWVVLGVGFALRLLIGLTTPDLEVARTDGIFRDDGNTLEITNVGRSPITITSVVINDRADCPISTPRGSKFTALTLKVGDKRGLYGNCRIIRAELQTDQGSGTYSFNR
jgi:hypothetical protein